MELCSNCAKRDALEDVGFCLPCTRGRVAEKYAAEDSRRSQLNIKRWKARSGQGRLRTLEDTEHDRLRQQRHRDLVRLRPREPAVGGTDPFLLALEGLNHLRRLRTLAKTRSQHDNLEVVAETLRRLAWGPDD